VDGNIHVHVCDIIYLQSPSLHEEYKFIKDYSFSDLDSSSKVYLCGQNRVWAPNESKCFTTQTFDLCNNPFREVSGSVGSK
jgi:hypothetical protein